MFTCMPPACGALLNGPFTPASLLALGSAAEAHLNALPRSTSGGLSDVGFDVQRVVQAARVCANWMQRRQIQTLAHVGPFIGASLTSRMADRDRFRELRGMKARIKAGASIRSLHPSKGGVILAARARVVTIHDVHRGHVDADGAHRDVRFIHEHGHTSVRQPELVWAGTGGYWCHADLNDVEVLWPDQVQPGEPAPCTAAHRPVQDAAQACAPDA